MNSNYWTDNSILYPAISCYSRVPSSVDVVIIGGGIAGLLNAHILSLTGRYSVLVLEKDIPAINATSQTNGMADVKLSKKVCKHKDSDHIIRLSCIGLEFLQKMITYNSIPCDANFSGGLHVAQSQTELNHLASVAKILKSNMIEGSNLRDLSCTSSECKGGIYVPSEFTFHPLRFCQALTQLLIHNDQHVVPFATIVDVINKRNEIKVVAENGHEVTCKHVIYCTNSIPDWVSEGKLPELLFYNFISDPIKRNMAILPASYQYQNGYVHQHNDRVIVSQLGRVKGSTWNLSRATMKEVVKRIKKRLHKNIVIKASQVHAGKICEFPDGLPLVGGIPNRPHEYLCIGFGRSALGLIPPCSTYIESLMSETKPDIKGEIFKVERGVTNA